MHDLPANKNYRGGPDPSRRLRLWSQPLGALFVPKDLARQVLSAARIDVSRDEAAEIRA